MSEYVVVSREHGLRVLPSETGVVKRAAEMFSAVVSARTGLRVPVGGRHEGEDTLELTVNPVGISRLDFDPELDGFRIDTRTEDGRMRLLAEGPGALVAGVGKLLRLCRFAPGRIELPRIDLTDRPRLPVRGMYLATHFNNFYHVAPFREVDELIEDLALWGTNQLVVWFDMHHFKGLEDPEAQSHLERLQHYAGTAAAIGMKFGLGFIANEGYANSPIELRADGRTGTAHYNVEICPSKPGGLEIIGKWQAEVLDAFTQIDFIWTWPYDQGGCACERCSPWGSNGFLVASRQLATLYKERCPKGKVWLSTWLLDSVNARGEYEGLFQYIKQEEPTWFDGIVGGSHGDSIPAILHRRPFPERYPLACFPEISMWGMHPWGGSGANPLPGRNARIAESFEGKVGGGWPYSEGIYEDVNKFFWVRYFWNPSQATDEIMREYADYYLGHEASERSVQLLHLLESTHKRHGWEVEDLSDAGAAWSLARAIDSCIPQWAKSSWRWRILHIRAAIDNALAAGKPMAAIAPLAEELVHIYHAEDTFIKPASVEHVGSDDAEKDG